MPPLTGILLGALTDAGQGFIGGRHTRAVFVLLVDE